VLCGQEGRRRGGLGLLTLRDRSRRRGRALRDAGRRALGRVRGRRRDLVRLRRAGAFEDRAHLSDEAKRVVG